MSDHLTANAPCLIYFFLVNILSDPINSLAECYVVNTDRNYVNSEASNEAEIQK